MSSEQEQLIRGEIEGDIPKTKSLPISINDVLGKFLRTQETLNALASVGIATALLGHPFTYYLPDENVNNQTRCNGKMEQNIQQQIQNSNRVFLREVLPTIATSQDISKEAYEQIFSQSTAEMRAAIATKLLFRQGIMVKVTTPNGNPVMIYIGGISPYWRAGKVTACQLSAVRRLNYSKKVKDSLSKLMFGGEMLQIGLLVGEERAEQKWYNPIAPSYINSNPYTVSILSYKQSLKDELKSSALPIVEKDKGNYLCSVCPDSAGAASRKIYINFLPAFNAQIYFGIPQIGTYVGIGILTDPFDEFYNGSPLYVAGSDCQSPTIAGFARITNSLKDALRALISNNNTSFNEVLSKVDQNAIEASALFIRIPPPSSWTYDAIAEWAMKYLLYSKPFFDSMINFAVVLGELLDKYLEKVPEDLYPEGVIEAIEDIIYDRGPSYACGDYNQCYQELSRLVEDIYQVLMSDDSYELMMKKIDAIKLCRDNATSINESCVEKCVKEVESSLKSNSSFAENYLNLNSENLKEIILIQCQEVCTKFDANKYLECLKNKYAELNQTK